MGHFYGSLQGCRGEATRLGSRNSGVRASVQSYDFSIITKLYDYEDKTWARIGYTKGSSCCSDRTIFDGTFADLEEMTAIYKAYKAGKLKISKKKLKEIK